MHMYYMQVTIKVTLGSNIEKSHIQGSWKHLQATTWQKILFKNGISQQERKEAKSLKKRNMQQPRGDMLQIGKIILIGWGILELVGQWNSNWSMCAQFENPRLSLICIT